MWWSTSTACLPPRNKIDLTYSLRPYRDDDAAAIAELTLEAILAIGSRAYSPEQVAAWAARHPGAGRFQERAANGAIIHIAADQQDRPIAYALLEPDGHLDMLYCHPQHTRRGLAERLLNHMEQVALTQKLTRLFTEASELARPAFERVGYTMSHRRDFEINGVAIHNYAMEKLLD